MATSASAVEETTHSETKIGKEVEVEQKKYMMEDEEKWVEQ